MPRGRKTEGRTPGTLNKATVEAKAACAALVDDPAYRRSLGRRLRTGRLSPAMECLLWHYAKGKPKDDTVALVLVDRRTGEVGAPDKVAA
jgi:hypothetical protein